MTTFVIRRNDDRYPGMETRPIPDTITVEGTLAQADEFAEWLSNYYPGCDYLYFMDVPL